MIYLACPSRHRMYDQVAADLIRSGKQVYSPLSHSIPIAQRGDLPTDWNFWKKQDEWYLERCDEMYIITLPGWETSEGVAEEIKLFQKSITMLDITWSNNDIF